ARTATPHSCCREQVSEPSGFLGVEMSSLFESRSELARYRSIGQRKVRSVTKFVPQTCRQSAWHGKLPESAPASIDHLTSSELRAVVIELRPPDIRDLME